MTVYLPPKVRAYLEVMARSRRKACLKAIAKLENDKTPTLEDYMDVVWRYVVQDDLSASPHAPRENARSQGRILSGWNAR